ncbi:L-glutamate gamma-semialdehyde dehydrogenase [Hydrogenophaga sp.]|uniref:L-glutamate gamma-semialdehyde dehydrogenase n=1 Tax=Hydrogenophaga sp. TaxID=1904254 RepID=UPI00391A455D
MEIDRDVLPPPDRPRSEALVELQRALGDGLDWSAVRRVASPWVQAVRAAPQPPWALDRLLRAFPLGSAEGLALMRLAEALLRVPDAPTAAVLVADHLGRAEWGQQGGVEGAAAVLLRAAGHGAAPAQEASSEGLAAWRSRALVALARRAVRVFGRQFVMAEEMGDAVARARRARARGPAWRFSFDMLGEGARTEADAQRHLAHYRQAIEVLAREARAGDSLQGRDGVSIKLSALHPRYDPLQRERVMAELVPRVWALCEQAAAADIGLTIDAEEADRLELSLAVFDELAQRVAAKQPQWGGLGLVVQAYQTRALAVVSHLLTRAQALGLRVQCRLVKGAYWDGEIQRAQQLGLRDYPVFTDKAHTDLSYLACAQALLAGGDGVYPQFATHNAATVAAVLQLAKGRTTGFEFQRLHGMGEALYREVMRQHPLPCRVYAPVGQASDLLAYLVRRLLENGANTSFVHQLADPDVSEDLLLASPWARAEASPFPLPRDVAGPQRRNSQGLDLAVAGHRREMSQAWSRALLPSVHEATVAQIPQAMERAAKAFVEWEARPVAQRAACLRHAADALQADLPDWCALVVREGRKTWPDAVAEVREAIDFLRYYAAEAERVMAPQALPGVAGERNTWRLRGRGVWVCISPWNFPLAIFVGQVAAALVTGNAVLAKPAEQTPAVALAAVRLLHEAGVPEAVLQCLCGPGESVGAALVAQAGVAGVAFTGSTAVAKAIQQTLAQQPGPITALIAETGGVNAMVVDSTALPEQVADAVVQSAFRSAGQRCSCLRLLCVHEAVADAVIEMVVGAAGTLRLGDPVDFSTDVGPLIDMAAHEGVQRQLQALRQRATKAWLVHSDVPAPWLAPQVLEVARVSEVREEIFGPVLQVLRWRGDPAELVQAINALGYGLTLGIHSRIDGRAESLARLARVGNVYVNRNMVGAVVGMQPFGGEGLSGTGPKAGGPLYLSRFCAEQANSVNTAAAGGNVDLLVARPPGFSPAPAGQSPLA